MTHDTNYPADSERRLRLFRRFRRELLLLLAFGVFLALLSITPPGTLEPKAWHAIVLFAFIVFLWITTLLPLAVTSLLAIAAVPMLGLMEEAQAYAYFGSEVVFFIMGAFILGAALVSSGLSTRLATLAVQRFGTSRRKLILTIFLVGALGSCFMSEHAVAAMLFPIAMSITRTLDLTNNNPRFGRLLFSALAWGCIIGGTTTILGGGRGPLAIGILEDRTHGEYSIGFMEYVAFGFPLVLILLVVGMIQLRPVKDRHGLKVEKALRRLRTKLSQQGPLTRREVGVGVVMVLTVVAWIAWGHRFGLANIAICAVAVLFFFRLMTWHDVEEGVNWGVLLLYGGAICLGASLQQSGATLWLTRPIREATDLSPELILLIFAFLSMVLTEVMSNSAVIAVLLPVGLEVAAARGIDMRVMTMGIVLPSNFAFSFPMATPANALAYSSGFFNIRTMLVRGVRMDVAGFLAFCFLVLVYWPLLGYNMGS